MIIHMITAVWGPDFTRDFLSVCLPNQLCSGNLPTVASRADTVYKIYTRSQDADVIAADPHFRRVASLVRTEIIALDHLFANASLEQNALLTMTACHRAAVDAANHADAALMILPPDQVYSDGTFARCLVWGERGCGAVVLPGIRLAKEGFVSTLVDGALGAQDFYGASPRVLLATALPHLSPITRAMFIDADPFSDAPTHLYFRVGSEGFVIRALHLHLLFVNPRRRVPLRYGNFDTDYLLDACPSPASYHLVSDSDEMLALELSPESKQLGQSGCGRFDHGRLAEFYRQHGNRIHRWFLQTPLLMHTGELTPQWEAAVRSSTGVVHRALPFWSRFTDRLPR